MTGAAVEAASWGRDVVTAGDEVFRQLVLARIIEPASKLDSLRVLGELFPLVCASRQEVSQGYGKVVPDRISQQGPTGQDQLATTLSAITILWHAGVR